MSLLIGGLAFDGQAERMDHVKLAVLAAGLIGGLVLRGRNQAYRRMSEADAE